MPTSRRLRMGANRDQNNTAAGPLKLGGSRVAYFCMKCSQLFVSKDAAACTQCNPDWGGKDSLVGFLSDITGTENPNQAQRRTPAGQQVFDFDTVPLRRTGT